MLHARDPGRKPYAGNAVCGSGGVARACGRRTPVAGRVVVEGCVDELQRGPQAVGRHRPGRKVGVCDLVDDDETRVQEEQYFAFVPQLSRVLVIGRKPIGRQEHRGVGCQDEKPSGSDGCARSEADPDAVDAPAFEIDATGAGVVELQELGFGVTALRVIGQLVDDHGSRSTPRKAQEETRGQKRCSKSAQFRSLSSPQPRRSGLAYYEVSI